MKTRGLLALASGLLLGTGILAVAGSAQAASTAEVSILHGVPGATVDVYANGNALLKNFKPGTLTDPQMLPAGTYDLKVVKAGDGADGVARGVGVVTREGLESGQQHRRHPSRLSRSPPRATAPRT